MVKSSELSSLSSILNHQTIEVYEPHEDKNIKYVGYPVVDLFRIIYGKEWAKTEEILFICLDGYQPSLPVEDFKKYDAYLVFKRSDEKAFEFEFENRLQGNEKVKLGPLYLVWDNIKSPELREQGAYGWPYQVKTIDLVIFKDRFPNMAPPGKASADAKKGFLAFRRYCQTCHRINGEGGNKSHELNYPVNVTEYFKRNWLKKWIDDPGAVRFASQMPPLNPNIKYREKVIDEIISYLEAMKNKKINHYGLKSIVWVATESRYFG